MQASSEGRNIEKIIPTGRAGLPKPSKGSVSEEWPIRVEMIGSLPLLALLCAEGAHNRPPRFLPCAIEGPRYRASAASSHAQADWVAQRIDLPLAFAHAGMCSVLSFTDQLNGAAEHRA